MKQSKEITIYDIARLLSVSPATVSRSLNNSPVVNEITKKRVIDTAKTIGYHSNLFAGILRKQRTRTLGVIVPKLDSNFMPSVVAGIEKVANNSGYKLIISQSQENENKEIANAITMFNSRVDGLIVSLSCETKELSHFEPFFERKIPVIFFDRISQDRSGTHVIIDNYMAGYNATVHLISQGCKCIAHVTGSLLRNVYEDRMNGYRQALSDHRLLFHENNLFINCLDDKSTIAAAEQIMQAKPIPDGIFIADDNCAVVCMQMLKRAGYSVPDDVAIVGFNNDLISRIVEPNLSTVNYPGQKMGAIVAHHLINHLEGIVALKAANTIIVESSLIVRQSSLRDKALLVYE